MVLYERQILLVAFQVRTLLERPKLSAEAGRRTMPVMRYERIGRHPVTRLNLVALDEHFDLAKPNATALPALQLCNQLIHHYIMFAQSQRPGAFTNLLVVSDYQRNKHLFDMDIETLVEFFSFYATERSTLDGDGRTITVRWNKRHQDYEFVEQSV